MRARAHKLWRSSEQFVRDYTAGLRAQDIRRLFDEEATAVYTVLARDQKIAEPKDAFHRFWYRLKVIFLGLSFKLSPARRALFAVSIFCFFIGLLGWDLDNLVGKRVSLGIDTSFFWFFAAVGGLVFLLALELVDRIRVRDELEVARDLQSELLPKGTPEIEGFEVFHAYRTANEVGGDYYDFTRLDPDRVVVMVGDASGHGIAAGLLMAIANATLKLAIDLDPAPPRVLEILNRTLCRTGDNRSFMTLFYAILDSRQGQLEYSGAGHPFPLLRRQDGEVVELGRGGLPLGFREDLDFWCDHAAIAPGELLVLFSDGLPEAVNRRGEAFGYERLQALIGEGGSPRATHERILLALEDHLGGEPLTDDFSLVVLGRRGESRMPPLPE